MRHPRPILFLLLAVVAVLVAAGCGSGSESVPEDAVAVVDGEAVTRDDLDAYVARVKASYTAQQQDFPKAGTPEYQALQSQIVAALVQRIQYAQLAEERGIKVSDVEIDKRIDQIIDESFGGDREAFEEQVQQQGYTNDEIRVEVRDLILSEKLRESVTKGTTVTNEEISAFYEQNKTQFATPDSRVVRHILVKTEKQADDVYAQLSGGADFAALAKKYSIDPGSKDQGGELTITRGQTVPAFDKIAFELEKDALSKPVKTEFGYHVIQPISVITVGTTTAFKDAKDSIREQLLEQKQNEKLQEWLEEVRAEFEGKTTYGEGFQPPVPATGETDS